MSVVAATLAPIVAATEGGGEEGGSFLVEPGIGLMVWTLVIFGITLLLLAKFAFPQIAKVLDERQEKINAAIDEAEKGRKEAEELAAEYREQLQKARAESEEIITRARKSADQHESDSRDKANEKREEILDAARRDAETETRRAVDELRDEVAALTVEATAKMTRRTMTEDEQRRLLDDALGEIDFSSLTADDRRR